MRFIFADCNMIAVENPVGIMSGCFEPPTQIVQPFEYGDEHRKATCLWLKGLPSLKPTKIVEPKIKTYTRRDGRKVTFDELYVSGGSGAARAKARSKTFPGIAQAMAEQWG